ncbi:hypothetical protein GFY24_33555 [Nocardia sp. SYP-A9097]|uniref:hypothetical protein n=1 Tax=Nocardia sp. SYP-A9097 TaxID=2663237 RepID=UPI00129BC0E7|nr:hypothetical protein [Nocardia sp. SYP-A9097]MRH92306.1 hypothetical protein [Nocardia sp. SYP-A9097]
MTTIHMHANTRVTPEEYVAALTDFGPDRSKLLGNSNNAYLQVHTRDDHHADVTEGASGVWERLQYDWTNPQHVVLTTTESNAWGHASGHTYDLTRRADGTTDIDYVVVREGKNLRGWFLGAVLATVGKSVLTKAFRNSVSAIEAREEPRS